MADWAETKLAEIEAAARSVPNMALDYVVQEVVRHAATALREATEQAAMTASTVARRNERERIAILLEQHAAGCEQSVAAGHILSHLALVFRATMGH